jgi:hypothetical protein
MFLVENAGYRKAGDYANLLRNLFLAKLFICFTNSKAGISFRKRKKKKSDQISFHSS